MVRILEDKGFVGHESFGKTYRYMPLISKDEFRKGTLKGVISKYFNNSLLGAVSSLINDEEISEDELRELIDKVKQTHKK